MVPCHPNYYHPLWFQGPTLWLLFVVNETCTVSLGGRNTTSVAQVTLTSVQWWENVVKPKEFLIDCSPNLSLQSAFIVKARAKFHFPVAVNVSLLIQTLVPSNQQDECNYQLEPSYRSMLSKLTMKSNNFAPFLQTFSFFSCQVCIKSLFCNLKGWSSIVSTHNKQLSKQPIK